MEENENTSFIFYLTLGEHLPRSFYTFNQCFKELGFMLVPVRIDQLQTLLSSTEQSQLIVVASVSSARELKIYNEKIRNLLKYVLKSKRLTLMHLSSFSRINDTRLYHRQKNYFFMKYPLDAGLLSSRIARYYKLKAEQNILRWPGGRRAGVGAVV